MVVQKPGSADRRGARREPAAPGADELDVDPDPAVCDVDDALYRDAWTRERALALLHEESGTAFDPVSVATLEAVLAGAEAERPATPASARLRPVATRLD